MIILLFLITKQTPGGLTIDLHAPLRIWQIFPDTNPAITHPTIEMQYSKLISTEMPGAYISLFSLSP